MSVLEPTLRPYQETDLVPLVRLFTQSVHGLASKHYDQRQRGAWAPRTVDWAAWRARFQNFQTLVAELDQLAVGFIAYTPEGSIELLYVSPNYAHMGVATALYCQMESCLQVLGVVQITAASSEVAKGFFERQGFRAMVREEIFRNGCLLPRWKMQKVLSRGEGQA